MTTERIMPWIDCLPKVTGTPFSQQRDEIQKLMQQAAAHKAEAQVLEEKAYLAACALEGDCKAHWSVAEVEQAKRRVGW